MRHVAQILPQDETRRDTNWLHGRVSATLPQSGSDKRCHANVDATKGNWQLATATGAAFWVAVMAGLAFDIATEVVAAALFN